MLKYFDLFDDEMGKIKCKVNEFVTAMKSTESHIVLIKLGKIMISVPNKYYPCNEKKSYISSFNEELEKYFINELNWNGVTIEPRTSDVFITLMMTDIISGPLDEYEVLIDWPDPSTVLIPKTLHANNWFPEIIHYSPIVGCSRTYNAIIKDLERHIDEHEKYAILTATNKFGSLCACALHIMYKKEFPAVKITKRKSNGMCVIKLMSYNYIKEENFIPIKDDIVSDEFILPYSLETIK